MSTRAGWSRRQCRIGAARSISFSISSTISFASQTSDGRVESFALKPMSVADFYAEFMQRLRRLDIDVHIWTMPSEIENAVPFEQDRTHAQYDPAYVAAIPAGAGAGHSGDERIPRPLHRQGQPGAFLLGQLRSRGDALFRPHRAAAQGRHAQRRELGDGGSLFARSLKLRLLARQRRLTAARRSTSTPIRSRPAMATRACKPPGASTTRTSANSSCPTTPCASLAIPTRCCSGFCRKPMPPPPIWPNGTARRWSAQR